MKKLLFPALATLTLLTGCMTQPSETVTLQTSTEGWKVGYADYKSNFGKGVAIKEIVPESQSVSNWNKMLTIQFLEGNHETPNAAMQRLQASLKQKCSNTSWNVINSDESSVLYEWTINSCDPLDNQHEIARLLQGKDGLHRVAYVEKVSKLADGTRSQWISNLSNAYVSKNGKKIIVN